VEDPDFERQKKRYLLRKKREVEKRIRKKRQKRGQYSITCTGIPMRG
jgi:hypothetical protein